MPKQGFSAITITELAHDKAKSMYLQKVKSGEEHKSFSRYINDIITDRVEADESLSLILPFMQKVNLLGNSIMIKDNKVGRLVEVQVRGKQIVCLYCNKKDCVHVGFAYAIPEVYRVMSPRMGRVNKIQPRKNRQ